MKVIFLPRIDMRIEIESSAEKIYKVLDDDSLESLWNITVNEVEEIETDKFFVKTTVGDITSTVTERVENEKLSFTIEGGIFNSMGYILNQKDDKTEVVGWAEFDNESQRKVLDKAGSMLLESLKSFMEFLEDGGKPEEYDKKQVLVSP